MTPDDYECNRCHSGMYVPDGMDPLEEHVRFCDQCAILEIERMRVILSTPPTWLCPDCRDQWIMRDEAEKQGSPKIADNRDASPLPPQQMPDGRLKCPGVNCSGILNRHTPTRCPDCLQPLEKIQ